ncbi:twin-arginine translocation signal domain-containing protein [Paenibacillus gyeongsangnamensis]|uniref:twin-arginine translocation signal domain-containing protein n=1 Tax=Paenibacillus gyeongsangnamensis TaxID=3388067 RepID=UPI002FD6D30C
MAEQHNEQAPNGSRRRFLKYSGTAIGGAVVGGVIGSALTGGLNKKPAAPPQANQPAPANFNQAPMFFTQAQLQITEAAVERIFPKDDLGPGAADLGVAF